jgi:uncharacterized membrane protein YeaQ/YmgE (transglycosylase-associated protein family)
MAGCAVAQIIPAEVRPRCGVTSADCIALGAGIGVEAATEAIVSSFIWIVVVGFVAGLIARFLSPGPNNPSGFILTTVLGIVGAFLATFIGQLTGWYRADQGAGFITATIGALVVLFIWNRLVVGGIIRDHGAS